MRRWIALLALLPVALFAYPAGAGHGVPCGSGQSHISLTPNNDTTGWHGGKVCIAAKAGNDIVKGSNLPDNLHGQPGGDALYGGDAADVLEGGDGSDSIFDGNNPPTAGDVSNGGSGYDILHRCSINAGADSFVNFEEVRGPAAVYCTSGGA